MTIWYRAFWLLLTPLVRMYLRRRGRQDARYLEHFDERFGVRSTPAEWRGGIVLHCASVGESIAARPLITRLLNDLTLPLVITCNTPTGRTALQEFFGERVCIRYLPVDKRQIIGRWLDELRPSALLLMETEVWPTLIEQAHKRSIPVTLLNARMSEKSLKNYRKFSWLVGKVWPLFNLVSAQDQASAARFMQLGVSPSHLRIDGQLKFDIPVIPTQKSKERLVWVAASTHPHEDDMVLQAHSQLLDNVPSAMLIIVPRHPERFAAVKQIAEERFITHSRTADNSPQPDTQVFIADSMGEMNLWLAQASIAFIGGSLIERGGHNPIEAVAQGCAVLTGPSQYNFSEVYLNLFSVSGARQVTDAETLAEVVATLWNHPDQVKVLVQSAQSELRKSQGATAKMAEAALQLVAKGDIYMSEAVQTQQWRDGSEVWLAPVALNDQILRSAEERLFDADYWQQQGLVQGQATGRATAFFVAAEQQDVLLRHYYRGGLVGKFNRDRFKREAIASSRAMAEFIILNQMHAMGLPVPEPVAARFSPAPIWGYRADIIVKVIANTQDVFRVLSERAILAETWQEIGACIARFHQQKVYHSDLNCHNILLDQNNNVWLVDFDKCGFKERGVWQQENLERLLRSLRKEQKKASEADKPFHWHESDWELLLSGYSRT